MGDNSRRFITFGFVWIQKQEEEEEEKIQATSNIPRIFILVPSSFVFCSVEDKHVTATLIFVLEADGEKKMGAMGGDWEEADGAVGNWGE